MFQIKVTQEQFDAKARALKNQGVPIDGDSGTLEHSGVVISYSYSRSAEMLYVKVVKKPFLVPQGMIESKVREWFGPMVA